MSVIKQDFENIIGGITVPLWTNPSPTSEYQGGDITVSDMSVYDGIKVTYRNSTTDGKTYSIIIDNNSFYYSTDYKGIYALTAATTNGIMYSRTMGKLSNTSIRFGGAYPVNSSGGVHTNVIPLKIEGVIGTNYIGNTSIQFTPYDTGVTGFDITCKVGDIVGVSFARVEGITTFIWNNNSLILTPDYLGSFALASGIATYYFKASQTVNRFQTVDNVATIKGGVAIFSV